MRKLCVILPLVVLAGCACPFATERHPVAERRPHPVSLHGQTLEDDYAWLRNREDPKVLAYLEAENAHAERWMADTKGLQETLYQEFLGRIQQTDLSVPYPKGGFWYYTRTEEGKQYAVTCRKRGSLEAPEEVLLDPNREARGYLEIGHFEPSPDGHLLAYTTDDTGYRQYVLHLKDLAQGTECADTAERVTSIAWASDNRTLFFTQEDPVSKRSHRLFRLRLGGARPELVYEEADERFSVGVSRTLSGEWMVLSAGSHTTSELRVMPSSEPEGAWRLVAPRLQDQEYGLDHRGDCFWILVNDKGRNFRVVTAPVATPGPEHWAEVVAHREEVMVSGLACFRDHVVLLEREGGLPQLSVMDPGHPEGARRRVRFPDAAYSAYPLVNETFETGVFRYGYESFLSPRSVFELDLGTLASTLLKRQPVPGGWDPSRYVAERLEARAPDGTLVPISLVRLKALPRDGSAACLLDGYGAYGIPYDATFSASLFSLLDRGVVYAVAHVRGGGEFGKRWHDQGRMARKMNTFTDFIACAERLVEARVTRPDRLVASGGSAGGLLVGAVANLRPDLFRGMLFQVPFVDVINTMLDESIPLTVAEFEEWGNPKVPGEYAWIRQYSPYDNLAPKAYPAMLVRTGLNDSQVAYWEPAKYVARLRELKTDANPVLLKTEMGSGHAGVSGRYDGLREEAFVNAWILKTLGLDRP